MHHLGSGIWSQMRLSTGAILRVTVPATIMRSLCRGLGRKTSAPKRAISKREVLAAIISIAGAHGDAPLGVRRLIPGALEHGGHIEGDGAGGDHEIALPRAGTEDFGKAIS